jgi:hypothetical protein
MRSSIRPAVRVLSLGTALLFLHSCFVIPHDYDGPREITPGTTLTQPSEKLGDIKGSKNATFLFWGLIPLNTASGAQLADTLAVSQYSDVDGVTRVRIHEEADAVDVLVGVLTLGIFWMMTTEVEGEAHAFIGGGTQ